LSQRRRADDHLRPRTHCAGASTQRMGRAGAARSVRAVHAPTGRRGLRRMSFSRRPTPPVSSPVCAPINVSFPDLEAYAAGNSGVPYVWTFASSRPGPHVLLQALTHGNEVCGAIALDWALREEVRPPRGTLSIAFANVSAYNRFYAAYPFASRCIDEDFNRLWTAEVLDGPRDSAELRRARELRPVYGHVDYLLDLHSMSESCPPLAMAGRRSKGLEL